MKIGSVALFIHNQASIINEATGVAFTTLSKGDNRVSSIRTFTVNTANKIPMTMEKSIPKNTRTRDMPVDNQKSAVVTREVSAFTTDRGVGKRISLLTVKEINDHIAIQKTDTPIIFIDLKIIFFTVIDLLA